MGRKKDDPLRWSFCHKSQDVAGKLISSPNDSPRAYICDECVAVCHSILEDEHIKAEVQEQPHPLYNLLDLLRPEELDAVRNLLEVMLQSLLPRYGSGYGGGEQPPPGKPTG